MIIDTHCHYNLEPLFAEWEAHWQAAQEKGIRQSIVVGTSIETSQRALKISAQEPNLLATIGVHPNVYGRQPERDLEADENALRQLWQQPDHSIIAIGETGLDYFHLDRENEAFPQQIAAQQAALKMHIQLALDFDLPVILHVRDTKVPTKPKPVNAYWNVWQIMTELWPVGKPFILHCISGPMDYLQRMLELGAYVGVAGNVTYKNADAIRQLVAATPPERLLLETDAPYLPPQSHRGQACEPWMITDTADYLEKQLKIDLNQLETNAIQLFTRLS